MSKIHTFDNSGYTFCQLNDGAPWILLDEATAYALRQFHGGAVQKVGNRYAYSTNAVADAEQLAALVDTTLTKLTR